MRRLSTSLLAALMVVASATAALGQSEEEVAQAEELAEAAAAARQSAATRATTSEQLLIAAIRHYQSLTAQITSVSFELADVIEETRRREAALRTLRDDLRRAVVEAYIRGGHSPPPLGTARDFGDLALAARVATRVSLIRAESFAAFDTGATHLEEQRRNLEDARQRIALLRDEATELVPNMTELVLDADLHAAFAIDQEERAVAQYELEAAELEAALALVSPRALRWRSLVEQYFPETLTWAALQVLECESGGDPRAVNEFSGSTGLFQFLEGTWVFAASAAGFADADRTNPEASIASAAWLVARSETLAHPRGPWGHWVCQPEAASTGSG